ncbi:N-terminal acetyltransferase B complex catalytic subunit [Microdochium nivale]|nr:N-terminal acetyltransferase B complex catalytic subunit [Microdochium nivale]
MTTFRPFRPDDLNRISKCNLDPLTETYDLSFYVQYYTKWPSLFQVAEDTNGNIVGYIMGKVESSPDYFKFSEHYLPWHAHITALTVAPEARRSGVGSILTEFLEKAAEAHDTLFVDLFVRKSNTRAIDFYEKLGYSVFRVVKDYYGDNVNDPTADGEDAYDMRKSMKRDAKGQHVRENGRVHFVNPEDVF